MLEYCVAVNDIEMIVRIVRTHDGAGVKRKWNDDVVFRVKEDRRSSAPKFVNDTVRNDFHRNFLKKYIK